MEDKNINEEKTLSEKVSKLLDDLNAKNIDDKDMAVISTKIFVLIQDAEIQNLELQSQLDKIMRKNFEPIAKNKTQNLFKTNTVSNMLFKIGEPIEMEHKTTAFESIYGIARALDDKNKELSSTLEKIKKGELIPVKETNCPSSAIGYDDMLLHLTDLINNNRPAAKYLAKNGYAEDIKEHLYMTEKLHKYLKCLAEGDVFSAEGAKKNLKLFKEFLKTLGDYKASPGNVSFAFAKYIYLAAQRGLYIFNYEQISSKNEEYRDHTERPKPRLKAHSLRVSLDTKSKSPHAFDDLLIHLTEFINGNQWMASDFAYLDENDELSHKFDFTVPQWRYIDKFPDILHSDKGRQVVKKARSRDVTVGEVGQLFAKEILKEAQKAIYKKSPYEYTDLISPESMKRFGLEKEISEIKQPNNISKNNMFNDGNNGEINKTNNLEKDGL